MSSVSPRSSSVSPPSTSWSFFHSFTCAATSSFCVIFGDVLEADLLAEAGERLALAELQRPEQAGARPAREQQEHRDGHDDRERPTRTR
jgi:hypothetical protein